MMIRRPDDFHVHLRQGELLQKVAREHDLFGRVLLMPNTTPPVWDADTLHSYRREVATTLLRGEPLFTIKLLERTTASIIREAKEAGAVAAKLYPAGVTTNSDDGIQNARPDGPLHDVYAELEKQGMLLLVHAELPGAFVLDREVEFLPIVRDIAKEFPQLRIVIEHLTTAAGVRWVESLPANVGATITAHHLVLTLDDVIGGSLQPHNFCKPVAKRAEDRAALRKAATSGNPKFFFGSDSAPHPIQNKECASCSAGVFMPGHIALSLLAGLFSALGNAVTSDGWSTVLEDFTSKFGARFYGLPLNEDFIRLEPEPWTLAPAPRTDPLPWGTGRQLRWTVKEMP